jgi:hypothetical protein
MTQLEKMLKRREEERIKKEEKERIKAEKKAEKERLKKIEHKKKLRKKQNKRAYKKRREIQLEERRKNNDKFAYYMIVIMKNRKRVKRIGTTWWKTDAYNIYNNAIEENESSVICPVEIHETTNGVSIDGSSTIDIKYEIMIVEKIGKDEDKIKKYGARYLKRRIIDNIETILAQQLLEEKIVKGDNVEVTCGSDRQFHIKTASSQCQLTANQDGSNT